MNNAINWPADELGERGTAAEDFAHGRLTAAAQGHEHHADPAFGAILDDMREMGFLALCADERFGGLAQGPGAQARVRPSTPALRRAWPCCRDAVLSAEDLLMHGPGPFHEDTELQLLGR